MVESYQTNIFLAFTYCIFRYCNRLWHLVRFVHWTSGVTQKPSKILV